MEQSMLDTLWVLTCGALVFLMQAGFLCLESGQTRSKNAINVALKNMTDFSVSVLLFWAFGYALMFGVSQGGWIGGSDFFLPINQKSSILAATFLFQAMFCATAATIVSGAVAGRMRFSAYIITTLIISGLIYPVFGHWVRGGSNGGVAGWLAARGFVDFAGSSLVHSLGGWAALAAILVVGPRIGRFRKDQASKDIPGHNLPLAMLGTILLWMGWIGFNGGSMLSMNEKVAGIIGNTFLAGISGLLTALAVGWLVHGYSEVKSVINGSLAGLVAITASCHAVTATSSVIIGAIGALVMMGAQHMLDRRRIDDAIGAVPVHAAAGVWGTIAVALFGTSELLGTGLSRWAQLQIQLTGVAVAFIVSFGTTYVLLQWIQRFLPLRVTAEQELIGLNISEHGATTELFELVSEMEVQRHSGDFSQKVTVEPGSDVGQIATQYNRVLDKVTYETGKAIQSAERAELARQQTEDVCLKLETTVTELSLAKESLRKSQEYTNNILCSMIEALIVVAPDGTMQMVNEATCTMLGYQEEELVGQPATLLFSGKEDNDTSDVGDDLAKMIMSGEALPKKWEMLRSLVHKDHVSDVDGWYVTKDGSRIPVTFSGSIMRDSEGKIQGIVCVAQDITKRKKNEESLRLHDAALESAANAILISDRDGRITWTNRAFTQMTGYSREETIGNKTRMLKSGRHDAAFYADLWQTVLAGKVWHGEIINRRKDGSLYTEESTITPVADEHGEITHYIAVKLDVTERKKSDAKIVELARFPDETPEPVLRISNDGQILYANPASTFYLNAWETAVGKPLPSELQPQFMRAIKSNTRYTFEANVGELILEITFSPVLASQYVNCFAHNITERKNAEVKVHESENRYRAIFQGSTDAIMLLDETGFVDCNEATLAIFGLTNKIEIISQRPEDFSPPTQADGSDSVAKAEEMIAASLRDGAVKFEWTYRRANGEDFPAEVCLAECSLGDRSAVQATVRDVSKQKQLLCELAQAQKLESVGQLAAGIAHEINTPTQYVGDNTRFLKDAFGDISVVLDNVEKLLQATQDGSVDNQLIAEVEAAFKQADIEYLSKEIPQAIDQSLEGVDRVATIVRAMKEFSHPGNEEKNLVNLAEAIKTTITVARNEWKYVADIVTEFDLELPGVSCLPSELNQVFLNLIVNAAQAIGDTLGENNAEKGTITVGTRHDGNWAEIFVRDTGPGIPEDVRTRIFDPFFTTKGVGKGTGQGLAIARSVVVDKHDGTIDCETEQGKGTTFTIRLPLGDQKQSHGAEKNENARSIR